MVILDEEKDYYKSNKRSLLSKYDIPIQHLEFDYIEQCSDGKELEKILEILYSQEEGYYPQLIKTAENRLIKVKPKSTLLRKESNVINKKQLTKDQQNDLDQDLNNWLINVNKNDTELKKISKIKTNYETVQIRESNNDKLNENSKNLQTTTTSKRISSTDYSSWDKYDVDTEILKIDLEEEKLKYNAKEQSKSKTITTQLSKKINITEIEAEYEANYEKEKGNEFFTIGDYKEALQHYTNSINYKSSINCYNNRAITYIKLKKFQKALDDCQNVLKIEPNNFKALLRKSIALESLSKFEEAFEIIKDLIKIDANNTTVQELAVKLQKQCNISSLRKKRLIIDEIDNKNNNKYVNEPDRRNKEDNEIIIPIPGTSNMSPPHNIKCKSQDINKVQNEVMKIKNKSEVLNIITVDENSDDDFCIINHLNNNKELKEKEVLTNQNDANRNELKINLYEKDYINLDEKNIKTKFTNNKQQNKKLEKLNCGDQRNLESRNKTIIPDDIHSPYTFLKTWNTINNDPYYVKYAEILNVMDMNRIVQVIGCKLDNKLFSTLIKSLYHQFMVPDKIEKIHSTLNNIIKLPRFDIVAMFISNEDKQLINLLISFLKQHGKNLSEEAEHKFCNLV